MGALKPEGHHPNNHPAVACPQNRPRISQIFSSRSLRDLTHSVLSPPRSLVVSSSDINSDGVLDEQELEALFTKEVSVLEAVGEKDAYINHMSP